MMKLARVAPKAPMVILKAISILSAKFVLQALTTTRLVSMPCQVASIVPLESTVKQLVLLKSLNARVASRVIMAWDLESQL